MRDINFVIKSVAKEKNIDEEIVKKIYMAYWKKIVNVMKSGKYQNVFIKNVGSFGITYPALRKEIIYYINCIRAIDDKKIKKELKEKLRVYLKIRSKVSQNYYGRFTKKSVEK